MMKKKKIITIFSLLVLAVFLSQLVAAQGIFDSAGFKPLKDAFSAQVNWPPFGTGPKQTVSLGIVILVWIALFALLYVLTNFIPAFEKSPHKNAITWFSFALAGIAVTSTGFVHLVAAWVDFTGSLLFIVGFIVIIFLMLGLMMRGTALGGQLGAGGAQELAKSMGEADKEIQQANKMRREAHQERSLWDKENKALKEANKLLTTGVKGMGTIEQQLQYLIRVITQLTQVRNEGEAQQLKASFQREAAAVAAHITGTLKLESALRNLTAQMQRLEGQEIAVIEQLKKDANIAIKIPTGAAATPAAKAAVAAAEKRKAAIDHFLKLYSGPIANFEREQARLRAEMSPLVTAVPSVTNSIGDLIDAVIRDVNNSQYPEAVQNLNQALAAVRQEEETLKNVNAMVTRSGKVLKSIEPIINMAQKL